MRTLGQYMLGSAATFGLVFVLFFTSSLIGGLRNGGQGTAVDGPNLISLASSWPLGAPFGPKAPRWPWKPLLALRQNPLSCLEKGGGDQRRNLLYDDILYLVVTI